MLYISILCGILLVNISSSSLLLREPNPIFKECIPVYDASLSPENLSGYEFCLIGENLKENNLLIKSIKKFALPIVESSNGLESQRNGITTIYIFQDFKGEIFTNLLRKAGQRILGPTAVIQYAENKEPLPNNIDPLYTISMRNLVVSFSGFRVDDVLKMMALIYRMGGNVLIDFSKTKTTHLIASLNSTRGEKYRLAAICGIPVMTPQWLTEVWGQRHDPSSNATNAEFMKYKMLPFAGCKIALLGYKKYEEQHMIEVLTNNGGQLVNPDDSSCTHLVVKDGNFIKSSDWSSDVFIVTNEWFWACIQMKVKTEECLYVFDYNEGRNKFQDSRMEKVLQMESNLYLLKIKKLVCDIEDSFFGDKILKQQEKIMNITKIKEFVEKCVASTVCLQTDENKETLKKESTDKESVKIEKQMKRNPGIAYFVYLRDVDEDSILCQREIPHFRKK